MFNLIYNNKKKIKKDKKKERKKDKKIEFSNTELIFKFDEEWGKNYKEMII